MVIPIGHWWKPRTTRDDPDLICVNCTLPRLGLLGPVVIAPNARRYGPTDRPPTTADRTEAEETVDEPKV